MVFYFTATGNSLFVAKKLDENPISIARQKGGRIFEDEEIGIVCPVYCGEIPGIVLRFLKDNRFKASYIYMVLTYGMDDSDSAEYTFNLCKSFGLKLNFVTTFKMVDNYLPSFDMAEEKKIDKEIEAQLESLLKNVKERKSGFPPATEKGKKLHNRVKLLNRLMPGLNNGSLLKITDRCTGCGICQKVCPVGNITIEGKRAKCQDKKCEFCLACIQNCPSFAIRLKHERNANERYRNENISLEEIIEANNQRKDESQ